MTINEWKAMYDIDRLDAEEIVRLEREYTDIFIHCSNDEERCAKYKELYKRLDEAGDYEKMKHLWKVVHRLNIQIKK